MARTPTTPVAKLRSGSSVTPREVDSTWRPLTAKKAMASASQAARSATLPPTTSGDPAESPNAGPSSRVSHAAEASG